MLLATLCLHATLNFELAIRMSPRKSKMMCGYGFVWAQQVCQTDPVTIVGIRFGHRAHHAPAPRHSNLFGAVLASRLETVWQELPGYLRASQTMYDLQCDWGTCGLQHQATDAGTTSLIQQQELCVAPQIFRTPALSAKPQSHLISPEASLWGYASPRCLIRGGWQSEKSGCFRTHSEHQF